MANNCLPSESGVWRCAILAILGVVLTSLPQTLHGQQAPPKKAPVRKAPAKLTAAPAPSAEPPKYKGIWEPVNYKEDLQLTDVFFVSADVGYVSGVAGTILKTTDGGQTWTVQLGGDPQSRESSISGLFFLNETHGWAIQGENWPQLLRTTDGETWERVGGMGHFGLYDYVFTSENVGILLGAGENDISLTKDGGRTWKPAAICATKMEVEGLVRNVGCKLRSLHFPSPNVGYAVGGSGDALFTMKTVDGGETWSTAVQRQVSSEFDIVGGGDLFFIDENTGFVSLRDGGLFVTTDGGESWRGLVAPAAGHAQGTIKFADPDVGWAFTYGFIRYTTDGGKRWTAREIPFPAEPTAFSFLRRDRAYVVGHHGMIQRYRVVPATEEVAKAIPAPAMPLFDSPLDEQVGQLDAQVKALEQKVQAAQATENPPAAGENNPAANQAGSDIQQGWVEQKFSDQVQQIQASVDTVAAEVPKFTGKYRNLNLMFSGIQLIGQLFGQTQGLKDSFQALRKAHDPQAVTAALTQLSSQVSGLVQNTKTAFQKPPPQQE